MHNTFTYRHSELPSLRPEIKAEIVGLDVQIADLILKSQGNFRELKELAEVLDDCLDSCELNLKSIQIIPDGDNPQPVESPATMSDLPIQEQTMIFSTALFSAMVLSTLQKPTGADMELLVDKISEQINIEMADISDEQITASLKEYLARYRENPMQSAFKVKFPGV
jgi:hypothetical protein